MRIFNSSNGDPMLLDSAHGLRDFQLAFGAFLASTATTISFLATTDGSSNPYDEFLNGLRVSKGEAKRLELSADRWLELSGSSQDLQTFQKLLAPDDGDHRHWYCTPVSLIIEADDSFDGPDGSQ
ncbi:MAG: hypothetical protein ABIR27_11300 [Dokdonella sp.]